MKVRSHTEAARRLAALKISNRKMGSNLPTVDRIISTLRHIPEEI